MYVYIYTYMFVCVCIAYAMKTCAVGSLVCYSFNLCNDKSSKMAHFVFKCNKEDYLSV